MSLSLCQSGPGTGRISTVRVSCLEIQPCGSHGGRRRDRPRAPCTGSHRGLGVTTGLHSPVPVAQPGPISQKRRWRLREAVAEERSPSRGGRVTRSPAFGGSQGDSQRTCPLCGMESAFPFRGHPGDRPGEQPPRPAVGLDCGSEAGAWVRPLVQAVTLALGGTGTPGARGPTSAASATCRGPKVPSPWVPRVLTGRRGSGSSCRAGLSRGWVAPGLGGRSGGAGSTQPWPAPGAPGPRPPPP